SKWLEIFPPPLQRARRALPRAPVEATSAPRLFCGRSCRDTRCFNLPRRINPTPKLPAQQSQASLQAGPAATGRDGHSAGHPDRNSPVPSRRRSTAGRRVALCSSSRPGAGRWHRKASRPPSSGCPVSPRSSHIHTFAPCIT
uniref:Uncharacterized protein n=1 Tax=Buteo japonicus TaxID=224669 RepID=A0A8C0BJA0_9AVES